MIVGSMFEGDNNDVLKWAQHDVYERSLGVLISEVLRKYEQPRYAWVKPDPARIALSKSRSGDGCDHRALQLAHDLVAAYFRYACATTDSGRLALAGANTAEDWTIMWQAWFDAEARRLLADEEIALQLVTVYAFVNEDAGYSAEDRLCRLLRERYSSMPLTSYAFLDEEDT